MARPYVRALAAAVAAGCAYAGIAQLGGAEATTLAASPAKIVFVDVGQGDGVVMRIGNKLIVSDVGEDEAEAVDRALEHLNWRRTKTIDVAILTHPHDDHVRNYPALARKWRIKLAVMSNTNYWSGTDANRAVVDTLRENDVPIKFVSRSERFEWGGARWTILNPPKGEFGLGRSQAGNVSVAYLLELNGKRLLFTGDVEERVGKRLAGELEPVLSGEGVDVFLATHHGAAGGSVQPLLDVLKPRWVVISAGANNRFGHPSAAAVQRLKATGATIWCTAANGSITARISARGRLTWTAAGGELKAPWWSGRDRVQHGRCNQR
jgi:competence protein ComEC